MAPPPTASPLPAPTHRAGGWFLAALSALAILVATLHDTGGAVPRGWTLSLAAGDAALAEIIQNVLLFIPFGLALALGGVRRPWVVITGTLLSLTVECLQQWIPGRDPSLGDIVFNTISTAIGGALVWTAPHWLTVPTTRAARLSLATALVAAGTWLSTGWLVRPLFPPPPYFDQWTPKRHAWGHYRGQVLSAALGPLQLQQGPIGKGDEARTLLAAGQLRIVAVAGPAPRRRAPLLMINTSQQYVVFYVAAAGTDLVTANRTRASAITLEQPEFVLRDAMAGVAQGDTVTISVWRDDASGAGYCLARDDTRACGHGFTMGDGWKLIFFPRSFPGWALALVNILWMAGGTVGLGWWARRHPATGVALAVVGLTIAVGPALVGLNPTPVGELAGAVGGMVLGSTLRRRWGKGRSTEHGAGSDGARSST